MLLVVILTLLILIGWIYLAFFNGAFWQLAMDEPSVPPDSWPSIDIIVPARNEAAILPQTLPSLLKQDYPGQWRVIVVDDHSDDGTGAVARTIAAGFQPERLTIVSAPNLPEGWSGKVAAMQAGVGKSTFDYILFTDADILHPADSLRKLTSRATEKNIDLVSRMVKLHCQNMAEKLLIPAFVFFFGMLYPFPLANDPESSVAAAAGGVMLVRRHVLDRIGGLARIKSALIDDCALARAIKDTGGEDEMPGSIELTLTNDIQSLRPYADVMDIRRMIVRTAYTQLRHSMPLLVATIIGMGILFFAPILLALSGVPLVAEAGLAAWVIMSVLYLPMVKFYQLPVWWVLTLPLAAAIYIRACIDSAQLYRRGEGGQWKGRSQA